MTDEELALEALTIDPSRSTIALFLGMKGRGKSSAARMLFDAWPHDRVVIDPTGNARPDDPHTRAMVAPFASQLPEPGDQGDEAEAEAGRVTIWARIDPGDPAFEFHQQQATNMALHPRRRRVLIWRDEFGLATSAHKAGDADRTLLMSSRHYNASALLVTQRPRHIPLLAISQADLIFMFALPNPDDREHIAKNAGVSVPALEREYRDNQKRGRHAYLLFSREHDALLNCPELPHVKARGPKA